MGPSIGNALLPFMLHVLRTPSADPHTTNSYVTFPKLFLDISIAPIAENRDGNMLFIANSSVHVRSDC
jgi:hypothetical protein